MKRPTWATVVGILGIIFGCLGILGAGQEIIMPKMMEMQKDMFTAMQKTSHPTQEPKDEIFKIKQTDDKINSSSNVPPEMIDAMKVMWDVPAWFGTFSIYSGITKALISALYLLSSIMILQIKPSSIRLFYLAAGLSVVLCTVKGVVISSSLSFMGMAMLAGSIFGVLIDIVLITVVVTGNKEAFSTSTVS